METMEKEIKMLTENLRLYQEEKQLNFTTNFNGHILTLVFDKQLSLETIADIERIVFFTNETIIKKETRFSAKQNTITIDLTDYSKFVQFYNLLRSFKCKILFAHLKEKGLTFSYTLEDKPYLLSRELDMLQDIVNPAIKKHNSLRVSYSNRVSILNADFSKTE